MMTQYSIEASAKLYDDLRKVDKRIMGIRAARHFGAWAKNNVHGLIDSFDETDSAAIRNVLLSRAMGEREAIARKLRQHNAPVPDLTITKVD
jgi:hypothetical protein